MTELTYLFSAVAVLAGALSSITVWAPRRLAIKLLALGGVTLFLPVVYAGFAQLLALPKPVALEWWRANAEEATVLAASMREDEAIYLWLQLKGVAEPRAYSLPWHRDLAEQLQAAQREAEESQTQVQMRLPFEDSLDELEPKFYAMPQPQLPPKDLDRQPAQVYDRQAQRNT
jgi:hypothetical protein